MSFRTRIKQQPHQQVQLSHQSRSTHSNKTRYVVIDTETTGFSNRDKIVEIACITVQEGRVVDEYETLLQPGRDLGPVHIHGITAQMVQSAPTFAQVAPDIAARLHDAILVAHNINFDVRMLRQEADSVAGLQFDAGAGVCTYKLTGQKLSIAAQQAGLDTPNHSAITDARVAAELFLMHQKSLGLTVQATFSASGTKRGLTLRRPDAPPRRGALGQIADHTSWPPSASEAEILYLDALDRCLDDAVLSPDEQIWLIETAATLKMSDASRLQLHQRYLDLLIEQIHADGLVTEQERDLCQRISEALDLKSPDLKDADDPTGESSLESGVALPPGAGICFTGTAQVAGSQISRASLEEITRHAGFTVVPNVTKRCGLLVAADPMSQSGKARSARNLGIAIISVAEFLDRFGS